LSLKGGVEELIQALGFSLNTEDVYEFTGDILKLAEGLVALNTVLEPMRKARAPAQVSSNQPVLAAQAE